MKVLHVTMSDGIVWEIPTETIASDIAHYFAKKRDLPATLNGDYYLAYQEEFNEVIDNNNLLIDWADNNMDWEDVVKHAKQIIIPEPNKVKYHNDWCNAPKEIVET